MKLSYQDIRNIMRKIVYSVSKLHELNILHTELDMTMALCGHKNLKEVDDSILKIESDF